VAEIAATPGIGEKIAAIIWSHLYALGEGPDVEAVDMQTGEILEK
jgi:hypothetical protein